MRLGIESVQPARITGWAAGPGADGAPLVRLVHGGTAVAETRADLPRDDLRAIRADGCIGFVLPVPEGAASRADEAGWFVEAVDAGGNAVSVQVRLPRPAPPPLMADASRSLASQSLASQSLASQSLGHLTLNFQTGGTGGRHLREGWSWQEPVGTWAVAAESRIALPAADDDGPHRLTLEMVPFLAPSVPRQRLAIRLNGTLLAETELTRADAPSRLELVTPPGLVATEGENLLELLHPDHAAPAAHEKGSQDARPLSIRLLSLACLAERTRAALARPLRRRIAVMTNAWNERVNLPIWLRYYGAAVPDAAIFVIDHGSDDGSTADLGDAHRIPLPRTEHDDALRARFVTGLQQALLKFYDVVVYTDADELLVPDPRLYASLDDYLQRLRRDHVTAVGLNVLHALTREPALDPSRPILAQRAHCQFTASMCKPSVTAVELTWEPGFHSCDRPPAVDPDLFNFHIKTMDVTLALQRQQMMRGIAWSANALARNFGAHQRAPDYDFLEAFFQGPARRIEAGDIGAFDFAEDLRRFQDSVEAADGFWRPGSFTGRIARIPDRFAGSF